MTVFLVGAGPGDPGLLTVKAAELLRRADVVVYDRLVAPEILDLVNDDAIQFDVGKEPGRPQLQDAINDLLIQQARQHDVVVRLKGGDPFVFGRGGEEAIALREAGIECEVVPGITSAVAVPAVAGVPLTHREVSTSFTVVTGHRKVGVPDVNWDALGKAGGTIVILMGVSRRGEIARALMDSGRSASEPVAIVHRGTQQSQRAVLTTLGALGRVAIEPPSVVVIGEVAGLDLFGVFELAEQSVESVAS